MPPDINMNDVSNLNESCEDKNNNTLFMKKVTTAYI
jgi:hypothetical protein